MLSFRFITKRLNLTREASSTSKKDSGDAAIQRNRDEKLMFGGVIETKKEKRKRKLNLSKQGRSLSKDGAESPNSEVYWLTNLCSKDVKIFRKTSTGRYREVDKIKVYENLKPLAEENRCESNPNQPLKTEPNLTAKTAKPFANVVIRNITSMPLFCNENTIRNVDFNERLGFPSVTKILSDTMSSEAKAALERWKANLIAELGEDGFLKFNKEQLAVGSKFHSSISSYLKGSPEALTSDLENLWNSVERVLPSISDVRLLEKPVAHPLLKYKGIVDCVASYKNIPAVIEWKVSHKPKSSLSATYDAPLQSSAYLGALSHADQHGKDLRNCLVVVAYKDGAPADIFPMNEELCLRHWKLWLQRLEAYWTLIDQARNKSISQ